ncbi:MAG: IS110 family transposase [Ktedonobacteraceae bacterium]|nr:IS110 family transposase [Ktedonobacteraceae bacterium]
MSTEVAEHLRPYEQQIQRLSTIPGIKRRLAEVILAEIGPDMIRFPSAHHLASWAGMCPGNNESGGKRLSGRTRKGSPWLRSALVEAAHAAMHTKECYLSAHYQRLALRRGGKKATIAVCWAHSPGRYLSPLVRGAGLLGARRQLFRRVGPASGPKRLVRRLEQLGYQVKLEPTTLPA